MPNQTGNVCLKLSAVISRGWYLSMHAQTELVSCVDGEKRLDLTFSISLLAGLLEANLYTWSRNGFCGETEHML